MQAGPWKIWEMSNISFCFPHVAATDGLAAKPWCLTQTGLVAGACSPQAGAGSCVMSFKKITTKATFVLCIDCVCVCMLFQNDIFIISIKSELLEGSTGDHT